MSSCITLFSILLAIFPFQYTLAIPLSPSSADPILSLSSSQPATQALHLLNTTTDSIPPFLPSQPTNFTLSDSTMTPSLVSQASNNWLLGIIEGIWLMEKYAPKAYHFYISTWKSGPKTSDPADLDSFMIFFRDPETSGQTSTLVLNGHGSLRTGKPNWGNPHESRFAQTVGELFWPPEHNIFEAAAVLRGKVLFGAITYVARIDWRLKKTSTNKVGNNLSY